MTAVKSANTAVVTVMMNPLDGRWATRSVSVAFDVVRDPTPLATDELNIEELDEVIRWFHHWQFHSRGEAGSAHAVCESSRNRDDGDYLSINVQQRPPQLAAS
jgi:hypothetical protein